ncbi:inositol monophosphatase family protein [Thalassovita taeanensis]|uniref:Myo-inositol-1(Or 4)-monophosphatase n=1 Tax=Thalassovita taeanensis TaxID=657014 RepID=A0A1H9CG30_9RHOB|nr:3'(2'),5'-bisphosphate nucleotidase CysQ [Thalassovita taeanensis]SEQ00119.1 myo-inositol-1(or 4)-monophosphatase [Thalassovita taeanensis]
MPAHDLQLLTDAARQAGRIATRYSGPTAKTWHKPGDLGPVTEADLAVNAMLHDTLTAARPTYGWLSEETEDTTTRLTRDRVFIIDPIDGTRSFIEGADTWAHSLAIAEHGQIIAAAVFLPLLDKLYTAAKGSGAFLNGEPIRASARTALIGASMLAAKPNYDARNWRGPVPDVTRAYRPSLAYRLSLVAEGRYDAMLTLRDSWEWDIAAGDLILQEAGAITSDKRGHPLRFNNPRPMVKGVIAAGPAVHHDLTQHLAQWPG